MKFPNDFLNKIVCGDSINIISEMPNDSIDITITSPPYNIGLDYDEYEDSLGIEQYNFWSMTWLEEIYKVTKDTGRLYLVLDDHLIWNLKPIAENIGWTYSQMLIWCKPNFSGGAGRISGEWNSMTENVLLFRKGKRTPMLSSYETTTHNWFKETAPQTNFKKDYLEKVHPAQMPVNLIRRWIARTPGQVVLDPFCGAGSVCIAAKELGRDYIGIDISEKYCELARERLSLSQNID